VTAPSAAVGPAAELAAFLDVEWPTFRSRWPDATTWEARLDLQRTLQRARWAAPTWPEEYGGRGLGILEMLACDEVFGTFGVPVLPGVLGLKNVGPTLIAYGDQRQRAHLPKILDAEQIWCQGFSEPGSGSDLASLRTSAELDGDAFVVNGQKTWTSSGMYATHMELLARTDAAAPKHRGISALEVDMSSPGIEVRPIRMVTGEAEFAEVFFTDVRVPVAGLIGPLNGGWGVAVSTLGHERAGVAALASRLEEEVRELVAAHPAPALSPLLVDELVDRFVECRVGGFLGDEMLTRLAAGAPPGPEQSVIKLMWSEAQQHVASTRVALTGLGGLDDGFSAGASREYLTARQTTIVAGTTQIVKNLIAERILGLPRD
jgi:alkylation response protein AidB-like acyl-CoA dehydrogenase